MPIFPELAADQASATTRLYEMLASDYEITQFADSFLGDGNPETGEPSTAEGAISKISDITKLTDADWQILVSATTERPNDHLRPETYKFRTRGATRAVEASVCHNTDLNGLLGPGRAWVTAERIVAFLPLNIPKSNDSGSWEVTTEFDVLWAAAARIESTGWFAKINMGEYDTTVWVDADYNQVDPANGDEPVWVAQLRPTYNENGPTSDIYLIYPWGEPIRDIHHIRRA